MPRPWAPQRQVCQHPHRRWCPTHSSDEARFGSVGQEARQLVSRVAGNFVIMIHGNQVVRAFRGHSFGQSDARGDSVGLQQQRILVRQ